MSDNSTIEWTDATWNPVTGCTKVSAGCDHCYAETFAERWRGTKGHYFENGFDVQLRPDKLDQPLKWKKPRKVFVNSMSDLFHAEVPDSYVASVFAVMAATGQHTFQVLTKRHGRMASLLDSTNFIDRVWEEAYGWGYSSAAQPWPLPNVWLGVSVEDQKWADIRIPALLDTPAAVRFISAEPLLGPLRLSAAWIDIPAEFRPVLTADILGIGLPNRLDWVIVGGESGPGARPMHPDWARSVRDQCQAAGVAFLFKQHGAWVAAPSNYGPDVPERARHATELVHAAAGDVDGQIMLRVGKGRAGRELDGRTWDEFPAPLEVAS